MYAMSFPASNPLYRTTPVRSKRTSSFRFRKSVLTLSRRGMSSHPDFQNIITDQVYISMIAIFDDDGGGDVDFEEFVAGLSAFSSKGNKEEKLRFAFKVYDIDRDGYISNGELFLVLKMMVGSNLKEMQLQQIVDKTIMEADLDGDGRISFEEFTRMVESTDVSMSMTLGTFVRHFCHFSMLIHSRSILKKRYLLELTIYDARVNDYCYCK